jgi:hypothetical protein
MALEIGGGITIGGGISFSTPSGPTVPTFTYSGNSGSFYSLPLLVTPSGTTIYAKNSSSIYSATLGSAYNASSVTAGTTTTLPFNVFYNFINSLAFNADGTKIIVINVDGVTVYPCTYSLTTPYDITSLTGGATQGTDIGTSVTGLIFANSGSKAYGVAGGVVYQWNLSTPYDINSFGSVVGSFDLVTAFSLTNFGNRVPYQIALSSDGSLIYFYGINFSNQATLYQASLSTPYDITTIQAPAISTVPNFASGANNGGLAINAAGDRLLVNGPDANIYQFNGS